MTPRGRRYIGCLVILAGVLIVGMITGELPNLLADATVSVNMGKGKVAPEIFIVTPTAKGEKVLTPFPLSADAGSVALPRRAHLQINNADPNTVIKVQGSIVVEVKRGSPTLHLSGEVQVNVAPEVNQLQVLVKEGNATVVTAGGQISLSAGEEVALMVENNELKVTPLPPAADLSPSEVAASPEAVSAAETASTLAGTVSPPPILEGTMPASTGFQLSPEEIALLDSIFVPTKKEAPVKLTADILNFGDKAYAGTNTLFTPKEPTDPFATLDKVFSTSSELTGDVKPTTPESVETFVSDVDQLLAEGQGPEKSPKK